MPHSDQLLPPGKLPLSLLESLLVRFAPGDPRVIVGPRAGEDAAVLDLGDRYLVVKTDPITFATNEIGWYAVNVNANDVAVMGAQPRWFLATLLLPAGAVSTAMVEAIFTQVHGACEALGISLVGGHTEITVNLDRTILAGTMLGEVGKEHLVTTAGAQPGDAILLLKHVPIEGTALIALEREETLQARGYPADLIHRAQGFLYEPGISIVAPALMASASGAVHAMHDPTEGGVMTGLLEMARGAGIGMEVHLDRIPMLPESQLLCGEFGLDPLGTIASGALLVATSQEQVARLMAAFESAGYPAAIIGRALPPDAGLVALKAGEPVPWPAFPADEITRLFR